MSDRSNETRAFGVASFKALDGKKGEFEALVSVFGNVDHGGDRVVKGAFAKSLTRWQEKGDPIPFLWNHDWNNPDAFIGEIDPKDAVETDDGLVVKGRVHLDKSAAKQVFDLFDRRLLKEFSFGYNLVDSERKDGALELLEIDLFEVSAVFKGMNPETELLAVKSLAAATKPETKAGARHSKETRAALTRMRDELNALLADEAEDEPPKSDEAEATSKASESGDEDIRTRLRLIEGNLNVKRNA